MEIQIGPLVFLWILPLFINYYLAKNRKKNVAITLVLTLFFSWLITISLFSTYLLSNLGDTNPTEKVCHRCGRFLRADDSVCYACSFGTQMNQSTVPIKEGKTCLKCHNRLTDSACLACGSPL